MTTSRPNLDRRRVEDVDVAVERIAGDLLKRGLGVDQLEQVLPAGDDPDVFRDCVRVALDKRRKGVAEDIEMLRREAVLSSLRDRFLLNVHRHKDCDWARVEAAIRKNKRAFEALMNMEENGHHPDVYNVGKSSFFIGTFSPETPEHTKGLSYERAVTLAYVMNLEIFPLLHYLRIQETGKFDVEGSCFLLSDRQQRDLGRVYVGSNRDGKAMIERLDENIVSDSLGWRGTVWVQWA